MTPLQITIEGVDLASNVLDGVGGAMSGLADVAAGALSAGLAIAATASAALVTGLGSALSAAMENELVQTRLAQVIKSTGGAAGLTAEEANALADQFKNLAGGSDDAVLAIETLGLRSGNIAADQMPAFIQASLDLGAVMGDNTAAARLLALAQDDPLAAYKKVEKATGAYDTALEEQIKTLQDAGDNAGALALVMAELEETTGGAAAANAETLSGQWAIFQETLGEAAETVGTALLPVAKQLFEDVIAPAIPIIEQLADWMGRVVQIVISGGIPAFDGLEEILAQVFGPEIAGQIGAFLNGVSSGLVTLVDFVQSNMPAIQTTFNAVFSAVLDIAGQLTAFWNDVLLPAIVRIFSQITGDAPTAQAVFTSVMEAIQTGSQMVADFFRDVLIPATTAVIDFIVENWPAVQEAIEAVIAYLVDDVLPSLISFMNDVLLPGIQAVIDAIYDFWAEWGDEITAALQSMMDTLSTTFETFSLIFQGDWETLGANARTAWDTMVTGILDVWNNTDWGGLASAALDAIITAITDGGGAVANAIGQMVTDAINAAMQFISGWNSGGSSGGSSGGGGGSQPPRGPHGGEAAIGSAGGGNTYTLIQYVDRETASDSAGSFAMMRAWDGEA